MATEKLAEGIRKFAEDQQALEQMLAARSETSHHRPKTFTSDAC